MNNFNFGSGMPQVGDALNGWESPITLVRVREQVVDGKVTRTENTISFYGTVQPLSPREIELKPEGQRSFTWLQIHCKANATTLIPGQFIIYAGKRYKITGDNAYDLNGYREYHAVQDFEGIAGDSDDPKAGCPC